MLKATLITIALLFTMNANAQTITPEPLPFEGGSHTGGSTYTWTCVDENNHEWILLSKARHLFAKAKPKATEDNETPILDEPLIDIQIDEATYPTAAMAGKPSVAQELIVSNEVYPVRPSARLPDLRELNVPNNRASYPSDRPDSDFDSSEFDSNVRPKLERCFFR